jgi:hypothetical protein
VGSGLSKAAAASLRPEIYALMFFPPRPFVSGPEENRSRECGRAEFRNSLIDEERSQVEEGIEQLVRDNPTLSGMDAELKTEPLPVSAELLEEYYFLWDMVA